MSPDKHASRSTLLARSAAGDKNAVRELVGLYHDQVYRFGRRVCRDDFDADDAVQMAFITLARRPDVQQSATVFPWLMKVVRNACLGMLRPLAARRRESLSSSALEVPDDALTPEAALERIELVSGVHDAISLLDVDAQAVIVLRYLEGMSTEETALRLNISVAAMKSRLHRARLAVRQHIQTQQRSHGGA